MATNDVRCTTCINGSDDLRQVIAELVELKEKKFRGTVEYRFDGSGRIISSTAKSYKEISLTVADQKLY